MDLSLFAYIFAILVARNGIAGYDWPRSLLPVNGCKPMKCSSQPLTPRKWKKLHLHLDQKICRDLIPRHYNCAQGGGCIQPQEGDPPYYIYANMHSVSPGKKVTVTVNVTGELPVRGVVVQAYSFLPDSEAPLGHFLAPKSRSPDVTTFIETCPGGAAKNTLFMYSQFGVHEAKFTWVAPSKTNLNIIFRMTTVFKYDTFWVKEMQPQPLGLVIVGKIGHIIVT